MKKCRIIFMGTPDFAVEALKRIYEDGHEICLVITQPDKQRGRGMAYTPSPVKAFALEKGLCVYQPLSLKNEEAQRIIEEQNADYIVVAAYGKILPESVLGAAKGGSVNIHASLLPKYRGAAPINRAIMAGDSLGGVTVMQMAAGLDTGDMLLVKEMPIDEEMTAGEYHDRLASLGADAISEFLGGGDYTPVPQEDSLATYAAKIEKKETEIDFSADSTEVYNKIRGLSPYPCAFAYIGGKRYKLIKAVRGKGKGQSGTVLSADASGIEIACGEGSVVITVLQPEGKRAMTAAEFLAGNKL